MALWWFTQSLLAELVGFVAAILFVALLARQHRARPRPRGLLAALLAVATVLLDRALALAVLVSTVAGTANR
jgi:predicted branched-subunit amino acid permease